MAIERDQSPALADSPAGHAREQVLIISLCLAIFWASLLAVARDKPDAEALPALVMLAGLFGLGWSLVVLRKRDGARLGLAAAAVMSGLLALIASWSLRAAGWPWPFAGVSAWLVGGTSAWMAVGVTAGLRSPAARAGARDEPALRLLASFPLGDTGAQVTVAHCAPGRMLAVAETALARSRDHVLLIPGQPRPLQRALYLRLPRQGRPSPRNLVARHLGLELHTLLVTPGDAGGDALRHGLIAHAAAAELASGQYDCLALDVPAPGGLDPLARAVLAEITGYAVLLVRPGP